MNRLIQNSSVFWVHLEKTDAPRDFLPRPCPRPCRSWAFRYRYFSRHGRPLLVEASPSLKLIDDVVSGDRLLGVRCNAIPKRKIPRPARCTNTAAHAAVEDVEISDNTVARARRGTLADPYKDYTKTDPYLTAG